MNKNDIKPLNFREIILNTRLPVVFKQFPLNWACFQDGLEEWCKTFDALKSCAANFERITKNVADEPQWERKRQTIQMTAGQFLKEHSKDCDYWSGLNYKRRHELPAKCTSGIDFSAFGFPQAADDSTLWLSSKGANTPCHYDSYGCNIVVQIFGRKSWLLFPPNTKLTTTRIPYEESSIYCKENFYCPPLLNVKEYVEKYKNLAHHIILEPNDVLIVPKHWWHYVEALDISLSVNAWIPLECDLEQQIEECIVKYLIENFIKDYADETKKYIMNPNQLLNFNTKEELFEILKYLLEKSLENYPAKKNGETVYDYYYLKEDNVEKLLQNFKNIKKVTPMSATEFENLLKTNTLRYTANAESNSKENSLDFVEEILIDSICAPQIVEAIKKEFFKRYKQ
ncbi:HSPB1-associated protein 1 [Lucilia sericata]|uniref:HSPB1-associated protein 1 n=1 Tax=Lucilia sericata TaxID=13632 RepID=UPI0018A7FEC2|nr:HSPB1-associated protein 1 [Lucilia sericata]